MRNVRDFGAKGDGITNDTKAIQAAIDAGGEVYIPSGIYVTGTLYLKSHGGLNLEAGAILRASHNREDYNADDFCEQNAVFASEHVTGAHLITAVEQEHIFIKGNGIIDGQSQHWVNESTNFEPDPSRPAQMIFLCECKNVNVSDVNLRYGSYWHLFLHGCEDVVIKGLNIKGERRQFTNDGIDVDCCRRVCISDCVIDTGDDGITLRGSNRLLKNKAGCEDVVVSNCVLSSGRDYAIRVGVGHAPIRNCMFSNIRIRNSHLGIGMTACFALFGATKGAQIENIDFNNISVDARRPIDIRLASQENCELEPPCYIKNLRLTNIRAKGIRDSHLYGHKNGEFSNIVLNNCEFTVGGRGKITEDMDENGLWDSCTDDSGFVIKNAKNIEMNNVKFSWADNAKDWDYDCAVIDSENVTFNNCETTKGIKK